MSNIHNPKYAKYYEEIIKFYKLGFKPKEISKLLNNELTSIQIGKIAYRLGITNSNEKRDKYKEIDDKAYEMTQSGISQTQIAKILGVDQQSMTLRLKKYYGIKILPDGKKDLSNDYFEEINTKEKAYWLGFLFADGYVSTENSLELSVKKQDELNLEKFKNAIMSKHLIQQKKVFLNGKIFHSVRISIKDTKFVSDLKSHGCVNNKSFVVEFPKIPKFLYRDFLEGVFDGDGSCGIYHNYLTCSICTASEKFANQLKNFICNIVEAKFSLKKYRNLFTIRSTSQESAYKFLKYIYSKATTDLDRKYNIYLEFCRLKNIPQDSLDY